MRILDIGCGAGTLDYYFANKVRHIKGIDISKKAIMTCRDTARFLGINNVTFERKDFMQERLTGCYDLIIFSEVIEHLEDDKKALKKINKLLRRGGILILSTPSIKAPLHRLGLTKDFDKRVGHLRRYEMKHLHELIEGSGFTIVETRRVEGIIRNFLFVNKIAGKFVRIIKYFIADIVSFVDLLTIHLFGESNYLIVAKKN